MEIAVYRRNDYASFGRRFLAVALDGLVIAVLDVLTLVIAGILRAPVEPLQVIVPLFYIFVYKADGGDTIGYRLAGIRIVAVDGSEPRFWQMVVREICAILSAVLFFAGMIAMLFDHYHQTWHDRVAGTYVIKRGAQPFYTFRTERERMVNIPGFIRLSAVSIAIIAVLVGSIFYFMRRHPACAASVAFIRQNPQVAEMVGGEIEKTRCVSIKTHTRGEAGEARVIIQIIGNKGEIMVRTELTKSGRSWKVIRASIIGGDEVEELEVGEGMACGDRPALVASAAL